MKAWLKKGSAITILDLSRLSKMKNWLTSFFLLTLLITTSSISCILLDNIELMKAIAYNTEPFEKEFLAKANQKKHDITLIANPLSDDTINYAAGKEAAIVFTNDGISTSFIEKLAGLGIKYIVTCCSETNAIDQEAAVIYGIKISTISTDLLQEKTNNALREIADQTIKNLDLWQQNKSTTKPTPLLKTYQ